MANVRVAYTGLRNPGIVRLITAADFKANGFPGVKSIEWNQANSWRVFIEGAEDDLVDFFKEQEDFRVTEVAAEDAEADAAEAKKDDRASRKAAAEADTEPVVDPPERPGGDVGPTSTTTVASSAPARTNP